MIRNRSAHSLGQWPAEQRELKMTVPEAEAFIAALDQAMDIFSANPSEPCVIHLFLNDGRLDGLRKRLKDTALGIGSGTFTSSEIGYLKAALDCGDEIIEREASTVTLPKRPSQFPVGLAISGLLAAASIGISAYHGYKRNDSVGWGAWWGFMGLMLPVITPAVAIAQGYGKREK